MPTLTDTTLIVRCPYCMTGIDFRQMTAYEGWAVRVRRLRPHGAPQRARVPVHLAHVLRAVARNALD